jgi:hypothetical protein
LAGFLVVAAHLSRYGISSFSVLQLQYLIAGGWALGPPIFFLAIIHTGREFDKRAAPETPGKYNWRRLLISSTLTSIPQAICVGLIAIIPGFVDGINWGMEIRLYLFYWAIACCSQLLWFSWKIPTEKETWLVNRRHAAPFYVTTLLSVALAFLVWFAVRIYPLIPSSLGGGRPLTVVFVEGEKTFPGGISADAGLKRSVPYRLLVATDKSYFVLSPDRNEQSIEVSRESVAGMIVLAEHQNQ